MEVEGLQGRKRIAVLFPALLGGGGAEAVCVWILNALKDDYYLSLATLIPVDLQALDDTFGTTLAAADIAMRCILPPRVTPAFRLAFGRLARFTRKSRQHLLMRRYRWIAHDFDLGFSAYNEMDLNISGVQYLHDTPRSRLGGPLLRRLSWYSEDRMMANVTIAPSAWLQGIYQEEYGRELKTIVVRPPARGGFTGTAWGARADGFLCIARLSREKNVDLAVDILGQVRHRGYNVTLRILTAGGRWPYDRSIRHLVATNASWVTLHERLNDDAYRQMLASHKYGISSSAHEGFGIGIAELINAGCIPFVGGSGGQAEAIGPLDALTFTSPGEAVSRICAMLSNPSLQECTLGVLRSRVDQTTTETFQREIRSVVFSLVHSAPPAADVTLEQ